MEISMQSIYSQEQFLHTRIKDFALQHSASCERLALYLFAAYDGVNIHNNKSLVIKDKNMHRHRRCYVKL